MAKMLTIWMVFLFLLALLLLLLYIFVNPGSSRDFYKKEEDTKKTFYDLFHTLEYGSLKIAYTFRTYEELFSRFKGKNPVILEIGVRGGGGIELFYKYFGGQCEIYGVDIEERVTRIQKGFPEVKIFIGDQGDKTFMEDVARQIGKPIDIVLDDGGHFMHQQIYSLEALFPFVNQGGVYVIEDVGTSYQPSFNNQTTPTLVEYLKTRLDETVSDKAEMDWKNIKSIQFYKDVVAIQKDHDIPFGFIYKDKRRFIQPECVEELPDPFDVDDY